MKYRYDCVLAAVLAVGGLTMSTGCAPRAKSASTATFNSSACAENALRSGSRDTGASRVFERACTRDDVRACSLLGVLQETDASAARSSGASWNLYSRACERGYPQACANLGDMHRRRANQSGRAAELYDFACARGVARACDELAAMHDHGDGVPRDAVRAVRLGHTACTLGYGPACLRVGHTQERQGRTALAAQWYREGCKQGALKGCEALDRLFAQRRK